MSLIPPSETLSVEFKSDRKTISDTVISEEVVALANTDGGDLYVGVEDDGSVTGAQPQHRDPIRMTAMIANKTVPPISVRSEILDEELPVLHVEVPRSLSIVATSSGKMLRRRLKEDGRPASVPMYPYEIATRLSDLGRLDYSAQPMPDSSRDDFDPIERQRLRRIISSSRNSDRSLLELEDEELEQALGLTTTVGDKQVSTLAGVLILGKETSIKRLAPSAGSAFQVLQGTDIKVNDEYGGGLLKTIERISEAIEPWNPVTEIPYGLFTDPVPAFDRRALREALVNAFGHRDYSILGNVRVLIDDTGITISNPGGFVEGVTVKTLLTAEPHGRNPCLMDALKRIGLAERTGRGVDRIFEGSLLYGRPLPDYSESTSTVVRLFIARSEPDLAFVSLLADESRKSGKPMPIQSLLVLDALKRMRRASVSDLQAEVDIQPARLKQTVELLTEAGLVEASGNGRSRMYHLSSHLYKSAGKGLEYVRQTDIDRLRYPELIMKLAESQGRVSTASVGELLHIDKNSAYYEIRKLVNEGRLRKEKNGPDAYYTPVNV